MTTKREVSELLSLDTFQGMTDDEIQSIIDYKMRVAFDSALTSAIIAEHTEHLNNIAEDNRRNMETINDMVKSIVRRQVPMQEVPK